MNRPQKEKKSVVPFLREQESLPFLMALFDGSFSIDWIQELTQLKTSQLLNVIEAAVRDGWLVRESPGLYRSADAKKRLLPQERFSPDETTLLHRSIAAILMRDLPDDDSKAAQLAPHLLCITNDEQGCMWLARAGDLCEAARAGDKALQYYVKCLEDLNGVTTESADRLFIETAVKYSRLSPLRHDTIKALSVLEKAMERAERRNSLSSEVLLSMHLAKNEWLRSRYAEAARYFESGWSKVSNLGDPKLWRSAAIYKIFYYYWCGRFRDAIQFYESSVAMSDETDTSKLPLLAEGMVAHCYAQIGQITRGMSMLDAIRKRSLEKKESYGSVEAGVVMGLVMLDLRAADEAVTYLEQTIKEMRHNQNKVAWITAELGLAFAYYLKGDTRRSITCLRALIREFTEIHVNVRPFPYLIELCFAMEEGNLPRVDEVSLDKEIHRAIRLDNIFMKGVAYRFQALMHRRASHPRKKIVHALNLSVKWLEKSGHQAELARSHIELAREHLLAANRDEAVTEAQRAYDLLSPINRELFPGDLRPLISELSLHDSTLQEIVGFSEHIAHMRDGKDIIQQILLAINRIKGSERAALFLLDDPSGVQEPRLSVSRNLTAADIAHPAFASSRAMIRDVVRAAHGQVMDISQAGRVDDATGHRIRSSLCVPVILRGNVIGLLYFDNRFHSQIFRDEDIGFVGHFAAMAALALDSSMAREEIQKLNKKLREEKQTYKPQHLENLHFEGIVGESPPVRHVMSQIAQVASADTTVMVLGETGVGKELVARAIHRYSPRWNKPFVRVLCSTLPSTLIPSELFGHEKGAFTGAVNRRIGKFELADQGTIFLDEVGDIPLETQVRLLQVLQNKEFERIGGNKTVRSDFRLIAATNRDLEQEVVTHSFREDLYYRLNVFPIRVPPLRERKEDIPLLVHYFLKKYALEMGRRFNTIEDSDMEQLMRYDWPGNVRELENIIERGTILGHGSRFVLPDLGIGHLGRTPAKTTTTLKENERTHILWALEQTNWKLRGPNGTAELLDIHPSTLEFRMKKLGILRPQRPHREH